MLKLPNHVKLEQQAASGLSALIEEVPLAEVEETRFEPTGGQDSGIDFIMQIKASGKAHTLVCEVKANGQPRNARHAILQLRNYLVHFGNGASPVFIAPYISREVRELCRENGVNFYDLHGNCRIALAGLFIERAISEKPPAERRELKSLFKPKSARVLRLLLRDPSRRHRLTEIAEEAKVSIGQVHNVKEALVAREWAAVTPEGLTLAKPDVLLDKWRDAYDKQIGRPHHFYTPLHGKGFEETIRRVMPIANEEGHAALASFSAADWLAPYVRNDTHFIYVDEVALAVIEKELNLRSISKGANIIMTCIQDEGPFLDAFEPVTGLRITSPVQTYLDLNASGERGREAAEHLRREKMSWLTE